MDDEEISKRFSYHTPTTTTMHEHAIVRASFNKFVSNLVKVLPEGRERSLTITHLEEAAFWANAAIARNS